jgi:hypothetical protein
MYLPDITLALFSLFNVLRLGSYLPQIARVAADREGAKAISYLTWCLWIVPTCRLPPTPSSTSRIGPSLP